MEQETNRHINIRLQQAIKAVIDQQIAEKDPPETGTTFERLLEEGFTVEEAYRLIGQLVSLEVAEEIRGAGGLNVNRYIAGLQLLPAPFAKARRLDEELD
jgi:hypothetical protein